MQIIVSEFVTTVNEDLKASGADSQHFFIKLSCLLSVLLCISCLVGFISVIRVVTLPHVRNP